jgi:DNA-binding MarR family transcriptional regulator
MAKPPKSLCEPGQARPPRSSREEAIPELLKTADVVRKRIAHQLSSFGVTPQQYNVLRILRGAGPSGLPTLDIGQRLIEETPGITRLIDRMETHGWVERERSKDDRRLVLCRLTTSGLRLLDELDPVVRSAPAEVLNRLTESEARTLRTLLSKIRAAT